MTLSTAGSRILDENGRLIGTQDRPIYTRDFGLEVSLNRVPSYDTVNKFGKAPLVTTAPTDIWDGANGVYSQVWVPPTAPRVHFLASTDPNDTAAGTGVQEVRIWGLSTFDNTEISETREMNGTSNVGTFSYAIIHRMQAIRWGSAGVAQGDITATADVDGTVTAVILAGMNRTNMMVYGVPSTQKLKVARFNGQIIKGLGNLQSADGMIMVMPEPATYVVDNTAWVGIQTFLLTNNSPPWEHEYDPVYKGFDEPFIIKMQVVADQGTGTAYGNMDAFRVNV